MRTVQISLIMATLAALGLIAPSAAIEPTKSSPLSVNELSLEVTALRAIYQLDLTKNQLQTLRKLAKETTDDVGARQAAKASNDFRTTLIRLREALVKANDDERIGDLLDHLDKLRDSENPEVDDSMEITEEARRRAPEFLKQLSARQVAAHLAGYGDQIPDPLELLLSAMEKVRGLKEKEWKQAREEISESVAHLTAGLDVEKAGQTADKVVQLLIQVRALKDGEFKSRHQELEKLAQEIVGTAGPFEVLRHLVEQALAELLSNPRLEAAVDARLKNNTPPSQSAGK